MTASWLLASVAVLLSFVAVFVWRAVAVLVGRVIARGEREDESSIPSTPSEPNP